MKKNKTERGVSALVANLQAKPVKFGRGAVSSSYRYGAAGRVRLIHVPRWWHLTPVLPDDQANSQKRKLTVSPGRSCLDLRSMFAPISSRS
ncbi:hypothetical protein ACVWYQ_004031 [Bradyrhizobium sp. USDA 3397]